MEDSAKISYILSEYLNPDTMPTQPIILLTFSNNVDDYLPMIEREQKAIKVALLDFADKNYLQIRDVPRASTEEVFSMINRYHNRVAILHYGGHADGKGLQLEKEIGQVQTANVKGIAGLLGTQKQLKLVFLNGCATRGQVKTLLDQGVKAVIATRVTVKDSEAELFATQFYQALATGSTIRDAYQKAKARVESEAGVAPIATIEATRGIKLEGASEDIPWGLYWKTEGDAVLDWTLPKESAFALNINTSNIGSKGNNIINSHLVFETLVAVKDGDPAKELFDKLTKEIEDGRPAREPTDAEMKKVVLDSYPTPIRAHLRDLFSSKLPPKYDEIRLRQLWTTYHKTAKFMAFIVLSDLWDAQISCKKPLNISEAGQLQLKAFFELNEFTAPAFDYFQWADALLHIVDTNDIQCYLKELNLYKGGWAKVDKLSEVHEHFQLIRTVLEDDVPSRLIEDYCILSEQRLTSFLCELKFLVNYKMAIVKNIEVYSRRNMPPPLYYGHTIVELNDEKQTGSMDGLAKLQEPTDMESVLLYEHYVNDSLNLSPFVVDENALNRTDNFKLFFFSHTSEAGLHYYWIENEEDTLIISDNKFKDIKDQFERARQDILNEKQAPATTSEIEGRGDIRSFLKRKT